MKKDQELRIHDEMKNANNFMLALDAGAPLVRRQLIYM